MMDFKALVQMINSEMVSSEIRGVAADLINDIHRVDKFKHNDSFISAEKFLKTYSVRRSHFDAKKIPYRGMLETLEYLSKRSPYEVLSISHIVSSNTHYLVLIANIEAPIIVGAFCWDKRV